MTAPDFGLRPPKRLTEEEAGRCNALQLAYLGDTVWDMLVRSSAFAQGLNLKHMHQQAVQRVNASAQAEAIALIRPLLTEAENSIVLKGRNAHAKHSAPHHQSPIAYAEATGLESLMGYLYLTGQTARIEALFRAYQEASACQKSV
ncbi:MAG: ribonuclease III [Clostridia bacterium]|nr:ribonuclease III [Clostridia bacterium]